MCQMNRSCIKQAIEIGKLRVIRIYPSDEELVSYPQKKLNRNIEAYDQDNNLIWVIEEAPDGGENRDKAYMKIWLEEDRLVAGNWIGIDYFVDLNTGAVNSVKTNERPW
jgi:hypothetical protein